MAEGGVTLNFDKLNCSICFEKFDRPKLLPCYHTFCTPCLDAHIKKNARGNKLSCPLCRTDIQIPKGGVSQFQSNFYIETDSSERESSDVACDVCGAKAKATHRCTDCEENFCQSCTDTHLKMKMSRNHKLIEVASVDPSQKRRIVTRVICPDHPSEELKFVCKQCGDRLLCIDCKLTEHENHTTKHISSEAKAAREKLTSLLTESRLHDALSSIDNCLKKNIEHKFALDMNMKEDTLEMEGQEKALRKMVDEIVKENKRELKSRYKQDLAKNEAEKLALEKELISLASLKENLRLVVEHESDIQLMKQSSDLQEILHQVHTKRNVGADEVPNKHFFPGEIKRKSVVDIFGYLKTQRVITNAILTRPQLKGKDHLKLVSEFQLPLKSEISGIAPFGDSKAWVSLWNNSDIYLVNREGTIERTVNVGGGCDYVTADSSSGCIVSCMGQNCIKRVTTSGSISTLATGLSSVPHGVAHQMTKDKDEILFSCTDNVEYRRGSTGYITLCSNTQCKLATEIKAPLRVAIDPTSGNMYVADVVNGRVTKHDPLGKLLKEYMGATQPTCIYVYDDKHILLCNDYEDIRLVNIDDNQTYILLRDTGRSCVAVDNDNYLWTSQGTSVSQIKVYKIQ